MIKIMLLLFFSCNTFFYQLDAAKMVDDNEEVHKKCFDDYCDNYREKPEAYNAYRKNLLKTALEKGLAEALKIMRPLGRVWYEKELENLETQEERERHLFEAIQDVKNFDGLCLLEQLIVFLDRGVSVHAYNPLGGNFLCHVLEYRCRDAERSLSPLLWEVERRIKDAKALVMLLLGLGIDPNEGNGSQETPLFIVAHGCAEKVGPSIIGLLLQAKGNLEISHPCRGTPLCSVVRDNHWEHAQTRITMLLAAGAELSYKKDDKTILELAGDKAKIMIKKAQEAVAELQLSVRKEKGDVKPVELRVRMLEILDFLWKYEWHKRFHQKKSCKGGACLVCQQIAYQAQKGAGDKKAVHDPTEAKMEVDEDKCKITNQQYLSNYHFIYEPSIEQYDKYRENLLKTVHERGPAAAAIAMRPEGRALFDSECKRLQNPEERVLNFFNALEDEKLPGLFVLEKLIVFLANGMNVNAEDQDGVSLIHRVMDRCWQQAEGSVSLYQVEQRIEDAKALIRLLLILGVDVKKVTGSGWTLLHHVASRCSERLGPWMLKVLVNAGVDLEEKAAHGETPFFLAACLGHSGWKGESRIMAFLAAGARVDCERNGLKLQKCVSEKVLKFITEALPYADKLKMLACEELRQQSQKRSLKKIRCKMLDLLEASWRYIRHEEFHKKGLCKSPQGIICLVCKKGEA